MSGAGGIAPGEGTHVAEAADLGVRLALGVKVRATLATAHVEAGEGVLEDLLKAEELEDGQVDRRVETEAALVRAEDRRELDAETVVDLALALWSVRSSVSTRHPTRSSGLVARLTWSSSQVTRNWMMRSGMARTAAGDKIGQP